MSVFTNYEPKSYDLAPNCGKSLPEVEGSRRRIIMTSIVFVGFAIVTEVLDVVKELLCQWFAVIFAVCYYTGKMIYLAFEGFGHVIKDVARYAVNSTKKEIKTQKRKF